MKQRWQESGKVNKEPGEHKQKGQTASYKKLRISLRISNAYLFVISLLKLKIWTVHKEHCQIKSD